MNRLEAVTKYHEFVAMTGLPTSDTIECAMNEGEQRFLETVTNEQEHAEGYPFLREYPHDQTFTAALMPENFGLIFGGVDKQNRPLLSYAPDELLAVLARTEYVATVLKNLFADTIVTHPNDSNYAYTDELVELTRRAVLDLSPLGSGTPTAIIERYQAARAAIANQVTGEGLGNPNKLSADMRSYSYPAWDVYVPNQELNFYRRLIPHVMTTTLFVETLGGCINEVIRTANARQQDLPEAVFGYLRNDRGQYAEIDLNRFKIRMLLHDIGRWITHHPMLHETLPDLIAHHIGLTPPLIEHEFDSDKRYHSGEDTNVDPSTIPIEESIFHFIDFVAKRQDENNLNDEHLRSLDQLAEHAIVRACNYNGALKEYLATLEQKKIEAGHELDRNEKVTAAIEFLASMPQSTDGEFYRRELLFLQQVLPFLGTENNPGILATVGTNLQEIMQQVEAAWNEQIDEGLLFAYQPLEKKRPTRTVVFDVFTGKK